MVLAAVMIMLIRLDFKPPGERILANVREIIQNAEIVGFLVMMMFAGTFWGYIETFLFWYLDDMGASRSDDNLLYALATQKPAISCEQNTCSQSNKHIGSFKRDK